MFLEGLTNSLLIEIVKYAGLDGSISTLRSLAGVNKTLNCIATPMMYLEFDEVSRTSVPKFLRTVLAKPQIATYVRIYTGYGISNRPSPEKLNPITMLQYLNQMEQAGIFGEEVEVLDVSDLEDADFAACRETLKMIEVNPERIENWMSRIRDGNWHALTSLLLLLLPKLEDIEIIGYRYDEEGDIQYALGKSARLQDSGIPSRFLLGHLTNVSLAAFMPPDDDESYGFGLKQERDYIYFADVMPFLMLPSVETVIISGLSSDEGRSNGATLLPNDINFGTKCLEINNACLDMWWLVSFLGLFTSLRRFSYNHVAMEQEPDFLPQEIGSAIAHLRPCLEELEISYVCEGNGEYTTPTEIGTLAGFEMLKSIDVEGNILFGYPDPEDGSMPILRLCDILPRALESLVITPSDSPCHEKHLRELLRVKEERFPELKRVEMKWLGSSLNDPKGLKREFKAKGVTLLLGR
ncbi:hypothetical protein B0O99DRAFT_682653 [Bisporella sp. PMI_857]|nr:hypothetical protein B0O99DRAFT_682653 [Bisporella sp. PMI_857]